MRKSAATAIMIAMLAMPASATAASDSCSVSAMTTKVTVSSENVLDMETRYKLNSQFAQDVTWDIDTFKGNTLEYHDRLIETVNGHRMVYSTEQLPLSWKNTKVRVRITMSFCNRKIVKWASAMTPRNPKP